MKGVEQTRDDSTLAFLAAYAKKSKEPIDPVFRHGAGVVYEIEGVDLSFERMKSYEHEKFLSAAGAKPFPVCSKCDSLLLSLQLNCPDCKKQSLARSEIMIHYECEYSAPVEEFMSQKDSEYVCPKCSKTLKRVGIEYGKPGIGFKCRDCGRVFQYPLVNIACNNSHKSKLDELDLKPFPVYKVNDEIQGFADLADYFLAIQKALLKSNMEAQVLARMRGQSGVVHIMPLVIKTEKMQAVVDFILNETGSDTKVLQKILRSADLGQFVALLFVPASLVSQLSGMVNPEKIRLLAIPGQDNDPEAVAHEVIKVVS
jgi:ribosomal protein L37AE/L43A